MSDTLLGQKIFISASLPADHRSPKFTVDREHLGWIEDAVIATVRAVLGSGGRLVLGGDPSIVPLVALVAGEYTPVLDPAQPTSSGIHDDGDPALSRPPVDVFQSRAYEGYLPSETSAICEAGLATIHWVESRNNERFDPIMAGEPQCERSLRAMRERLLTQAKPTAMVGIGGMEGLLEEFEMFLQRQRDMPVYIFRSTGGMARILANELQELQTDEFLMEGRAAQSTLRRRSSLLEVDGMDLERVHIVEYLAENRDHVHRTKRDLVDEFLEFRDNEFGQKEVFKEAINPPYGYLSNLLVNSIAGIK